MLGIAHFSRNAIHSALKFTESCCCHVDHAEHLDYPTCKQAVQKLLHLKKFMLTEHLRWCQIRVQLMMCPVETISVGSLNVHVCRAY